MAETLDEKLATIERNEKQMLDLFAAFIKPKADFYVGDMVLYGVAKRALALSSGFRTLIKERNFTSAAALLRMQLDTALRLYAARLVSDPAHYANTIYEGKPVNKYRDRQGRLLTDSYMARRMAQEYKWVQGVYRETSEFVHFTNRHIFSAIGPGQEEGGVDLQISARDRERPESDYFEVVDAFQHTTWLIAKFAAEWHSAIHPDRPITVITDADAAPTALPPA